MSCVPEIKEEKESLYVELITHISLGATLIHTMVRMSKLMTKPTSAQSTEGRLEGACAKTREMDGCGVE